MNNTLKRVINVMWLLLTLLLLTGCSEEEAEVPLDAVRIFCTDTAKTQLCWEYYSLESEDINAQIEELLQQLGRSPESKTYVSVKPDNVNINNFYFGPDGQLILEVDNAYLEMSAVDEVLCRSGIVKTLCQLEGVDYVEFYNNGQTLILQNDLPLGQMSDADFIDSTGGTMNFMQTLNLTIYLADETGTMMTESMLVVYNDGSASMEELVLQQLIYGPLNEQTHLNPVIPEGTKVNKVTTKDGICYVDFNEAFMEKIEGLTDEVAIYSVVNSLAELPNVTKVQFSINGELKKTYRTLDFSGLFDRRPDLITNEKAGEKSE